MAVVGTGHCEQFTALIWFREMQAPVLLLHAHCFIDHAFAHVVGVRW